MPVVLEWIPIGKIGFAALAGGRTYIIEKACSTQLAPGKHWIAREIYDNSGGNTDIHNPLGFHCCELHAKEICELEHQAFGEDVPMKERRESNPYLHLEHCPRHPGAIGVCICDDE